MKVALKLGTILTLIVLGMFGAIAWFNAQAIREIRKKEAHEDAVVIGQIASSAVKDLWRLGGKNAAQQFIEQVKSELPVARISLDTKHPRNSKTNIERDPNDPYPLQVSSAFVSENGTPLGEIEVKTQMFQQARFVSLDPTTISFWSTVVMAFLLVLVVYALGWALVTKPLGKLTHMAQQVAQGNFDAAVNLQQNDEIGQLSAALNHMVHQLRQSKSNAYAEHKAHTATLNQLRHADRYTTMGKLASVMAHDLGTPLNVVLGRASMIASDPNASDSIRKNATTVVEQANRMNEIVKDTLTFVKPKKNPADHTSVDALIKHAASLMAPLCDDKNIHLHVANTLEKNIDIAEGPALQVITNLIINAVHAMPKSGTITLKTAVEQLKAPPDEVADAGSYVRIDVEDEGTGIPQEKLSNIFKPFFSTKGEQRGTGLGLSICQGIIKDNSGFIEVQSELGKGSCFSVFLPERMA